MATFAKEQILVKKNVHLAPFYNASELVILFKRSYHPHHIRSHIIICKVALFLSEMLGCG